MLNSLLKNQKSKAITKDLQYERLPTIHYQDNKEKNNDAAPTQVTTSESARNLIDVPEENLNLRKRVYYLLLKLKPNRLTKCKPAAQDLWATKVTDIQQRQNQGFFKGYDIYRRRIGLVAFNTNQVQRDMVKRANPNLQQENKISSSIKLVFWLGLNARRTREVKHSNNDEVSARLRSHTTAY